MGFFLPFYPSNSPKNENFETIKKTPGDIISLHKYTKNHDPMLYFSWDRVCGGCFYPLPAQKMKISKQWINTWRYHHFTQVCQKSWPYAIVFLRYMVHDRCNCYFSFWATFFPFTAQTAQKMKIFLKKEKSTWRYHHFTRVYQKLWLDDVRFLRYGARWTHGRKKVT